MYDRKALECRNQATALERRIEEIRAGAPAPVQGAIDLMELTSRAADLFLVHLKSASWRHGELQTQFEEPFENLRRSNQVSRRKDDGIGEGPTQKGIWLPTLDAFRTFAAECPLIPGVLSTISGTGIGVSR